jgi:hypothetical protein
MLLLELKILPLASYSLILLALLLLAATHGALGLAQNWKRHFSENMESFFPMALALLSAPILVADLDQGMIELSAALPHRRVLVARIYAVWGASWLAILAGSGVMALMWGPVPYWSGMLAALGPAMFLSAVAVWATLLTARTSVGYLAALGIPAADLILRVLGAFTAIPALQLIDVFSYRWAILPVAWWVPKLFMLLVGGILFERAVAASQRFWARAL